MLLIAMKHNTVLTIFIARYVDHTHFVKLMMLVSWYYLLWGWRNVAHCSKHTPGCSCLLQTHALCFCGLHWVGPSLQRRRETQCLYEWMTPYHTATSSWVHHLDWLPSLLSIEVTSRPAGAQSCDSSYHDHSTHQMCTDTCLCLCMRSNRHQEVDCQWSYVSPTVNCVDRKSQLARVSWSFLHLNELLAMCPCIHPKRITSHWLMLQSDPILAQAGMDRLFLLYQAL